MDRDELFSEERLVMRLSKAYLWVGALGTAVSLMSLAFLAVFSKGAESPETTLGWTAILLAGGLTLFKWFAVRAELFRDADYFILHGPMGGCRTIYFADCARWQTQGHVIVVWHKDKPFRIDRSMRYFDVFLALLEKYGVEGA